MSSIGRLLVILGIFLIALGAVMLLPWSSHLRLPGDIIIKHKDSMIYVPVVTSIVLSVILTIVLNLLMRK